MLLLTAAFLVTVWASSHSEAPGTARGPSSDLTDFYMFRTKTNVNAAGNAGGKGTIALIANVNGLSQSQAGPNYNPLNNDYVYQIHVDNDGDAQEDLTFQFVTGSRQINNGRGAEVPVQGRSVPIPLQIFGPVTYDAATRTTKGVNTQEYYRLRVIEGGDYSDPIEEGPFAYAYTSPAHTESIKEFTKAYEYAGTKAFGDVAPSSAKYDAYVAGAATYLDARIPNCDRAVKLFVGPRREPFSIPLGETFDLLNFAGGQPPVADVGVRGATPDGGNSIDRFSVTSFVIEVPEECLVGKSSARVIGAWASTRKIEHRGDKHYVGEQTSRLGNPLVNELMIGVSYKNEWNSRHPSRDERYDDFLRFPTMPVIIESIFGVKAPTFAREDLIKVFHTGITGINEQFNTAHKGAVRPPVHADMLRLNLDTPYTVCNAQSPLGAIGDPNGAGFPNGRRLGDDVVDIALNALQGILCSKGLCPGQTLVNGLPPGSFLFDTTVMPPKVRLFSDLVAIKACDFRCTAGAADDFPYLNTPVPGNLLFSAGILSQRAAGAMKGTTVCSMP